MQLILYNDIRSRQTLLDTQTLYNFVIMPKKKLTVVAFQLSLRRNLVMADKRIDAHTNTTTVADVDEFIVDSGSNGTRNITYSNLKDQLLGTTSIATIGNSVTEAIYNVHMDQAVPKIDTTTGVMYLEGGSAFEGNIDSTPTAGSNNAVSSGGTKTYVDNAVSQLNDEIDAKRSLTVSSSIIGNAVNVASATSTSPYITPHEGFVRFDASTLCVNTYRMMKSSANDDYKGMWLPKGVSIYFTDGTPHIAQWFNCSNE